MRVSCVKRERDGEYFHSLKAGRSFADFPPQELLPFCGPCNSFFELPLNTLFLKLVPTLLTAGSGQRSQNLTCEEVKSLELVFTGET